MSVNLDVSGQSVRLADARGPKYVQRLVECKRGKLVMMDFGGLILQYDVL